MADFATGKHAYGFCERCGFRYPYGELKAESYKGSPKHNRVCPDCWDEDHPQNFVGTFRVDDPQALRRPAPDVDLSNVNSFPANVVPVGQVASVVVGDVIASQFQTENGTIVKMQPPGRTPSGEWALFTDNDVNSSHGVYADVGFSLTNPITFSVYIYGASTSGNDEFGLRINDLNSTNTWTVIFNYAGVIVGTGFTSGTASLNAQSISFQPDGSLLASITVTLGGGTGPARARLLARKSSIGSVIYVGEGKPFFFYRLDPGVSGS